MFEWAYLCACLSKQTSRHTTACPRANYHDIALGLHMLLYLTIHALLQDEQHSTLLNSCALSCLVSGACAHVGGRLCQVRPPQPLH